MIFCSSWLFLLLTPFLCLISFYLTIGSDPIGLKIGIVNDEVSNASECADPLLKMTTIVDYTCRVNKISCRFINSLNDSIAIKKFYNNVDDAVDDVKRGRISGLIHFSKNFTSSIRPLNELEEIFANYSSYGEIKVSLDQSDRQITFFLKQRLYETFEDFMENLMTDCGKARKVGSAPIQINTMFGNFKDEFRKSMTPGIIITIYFFLASMLTSTAFISDRLDGVWNRVLLAGVEQTEILLSHVISSSVIMLLQSVEFLIVTQYIYELENLGDGWTVIALIFLIGLSAICYGLAVSIVANDFMTATFMSTLIFYPMIIFCGELLMQLATDYQRFLSFQEYFGRSKRFLGSSDTLRTVFRSLFHPPHSETFSTKGSQL